MYSNNTGTIVLRFNPSHWLSHNKTTSYVIRLIWCRSTVCGDAHVAGLAQGVQTCLRPSRSGVSAGFKGYFGPTLSQIEKCSSKQTLHPWWQVCEMSTGALPRPREPYAGHGGRSRSCSKERSMGNEFKTRHMIRDSITRQVAGQQQCILFSC